MELTETAELLIHGAIVVFVIPLVLLLGSIIFYAGEKLVLGPKKHLDE